MALGDGLGVGVGVGEGDGVGDGLGVGAAVGAAATGAGRGRFTRSRAPTIDTTRPTAIAAEISATRRETLGGNRRPGAATSCVSTTRPYHPGPHKTPLRRSRARIGLRTERPAERRY